MHKDRRGREREKICSLNIGQEKTWKLREIKKKKKNKVSQSNFIDVIYFVGEWILEKKNVYFPSKIEKKEQKYNGNSSIQIIQSKFCVFFKQLSLSTYILSFTFRLSVQFIPLCFCWCCFKVWIYCFEW